jgi:hypothetical protein
MESHKFCLELFDMCSIAYCSNVNAILKSSHVRRNCDSSTLAMACDVLSQVLEVTVASVTSIRGISHIPTRRSRMEYGPGI